MTPEYTMHTEAQAYSAGWDACMNGVDDRYVTSVIEHRNAWLHGWLDAMDAEDGEEPIPEAVGY